MDHTAASHQLQRRLRRLGRRALCCGIGFLSRGHLYQDWPYVQSVKSRVKRMLLAHDHDFQSRESPAVDALVLTLAGCGGVTQNSKTQTQTPGTPTSGTPTTGTPTSGTQDPGTPPAPTGTGYLSVSPASFNFSSVNIGSNVAQSFTVSNSGTAIVTVSNIALAGAGLTAAGVPTGTTLSPGQSATLNVTYAPVAALPLNGSITFTSDASNASVVVGLTGTGVQPPPAGTRNSR